MLGNNIGNELLDISDRLKNVFDRLKNTNKINNYGLSFDKKGIVRINTDKETNNSFINKIFDYKGIGLKKSDCLCVVEGVKLWNYDLASLEKNHDNFYF